MTVSKKDIQLLMAAAGILAAVAVFFLVYRPTMEKAKNLDSQNAAMQARVDELENLMDKKEEFMKDTADYEQEIKEIFMLFPTNVQAEDAISEWINIEHASQVAMTGITYDAMTSVYTPIAEDVSQMPEPALATDGIEEGAEGEETADAAEATEEAAEGEEATYAEELGIESSLQLMDQPTEYAFDCDLNNFLKAVDYINARNSRDVISHISLVYDSSTGLLNGTIQLQKYYIAGLSKDYTAPTFNGVQTGSYDLFSTFVQSDGEDAATE